MSTRLAGRASVAQRRIPRRGPTRNIEPAMTMRRERVRASANARSGSGSTWTVEGTPSDRAIFASSSRSRRPRTRRRRADDGGRHRGELGQHPRGVLVSHGAKNKGGIRPAGVPQVLGQCAGAGRVVRCVEQELMRSVAQQLEPRWPLDVLDRVAQRLLRDVDAACLQHIGETDHDADVVPLVTAAKRRPHAGQRRVRWRPRRSSPQPS